MTDKTHFKKAFNSPYLSSSDIEGETTLTVSKVILEMDKTKKTKDLFNTAYFVEPELRKGEPLKPMILNVTNSKMMKQITGTPWIDDWNDVRVCVYVDTNVKMMGQVTDGLRIMPAPKRQEILPGTAAWGHAKTAYIRDKNFDAVLAKADISKENQQKIIDEVNNGSA